MSTQAKILVVDDHGIIRAGLQALLANEHGLSVVGEAASGQEAVELAQRLKPDVIVMDLCLPGLNGIDATSQIVARNPRIKVIGLTAQNNDALAAELLRAGAVGYVKKDAVFEDLRCAIRAVLANKIHCSAAVIRHLAHPRHRNSYVEAFDQLTARERELLQNIAEGKSTKEIATDLAVSIKTVETHRRNLMLKLDVRSIAELTKYAVKQGLSPL